MLEFEIDLQKSRKAAPDEPVGLAIRSRGTVFTRLHRQGEDAPQDHLQAPPGQLAFWLVDNWWRLRWECYSSSRLNSDWRLAHELSSIGGYAWPRLAIWGEGNRIGLLSRRDPVGVVGPVRYLTDALTYVPASAFELGVDQFLDFVSTKKQRLVSDWAPLQAQIEALAAERSDAELSSWRRLEAQLGYDVDEAPEQLMAWLSDFQQEYGTGAVAEAALAIQGPESAAVLQAEITAAKSHPVRCSLSRTAKLVDHLQSEPDDPPWRRGEIAAAAVRGAVGRTSGSLSNPQLAEVLHAPQSSLSGRRSANTRKPAYGLRLVTNQEEIVSLTSTWGTGRRFEFCRALGDEIWSKGELLGPITKAKSERQKFQRAFAQSLLCPFDELLGYIGDDRSDDALAAAAQHFYVSPQLVRSVLVNKRDLDRQRLMDPSIRDSQGFESSPAGLDDIVEAA